MLFCSIDSKAKGRKHGALRAQKKLQGIPSIAFLDAEGRVLVKLRDRATVWRQFETLGRLAEHYVRCRDGAAKGNPQHKARFLQLQMAERQLTLAAALKIRGEVAATLDKRMAKILDTGILHLRISEELRAKGQKRRYELGPRFYRMWIEGPKPAVWVSRGYWFAILEWAEREKKAAEYAVAVEGLRLSIRYTDPGATWAPKLLSRYEAKLDELRAARSRK